MSKIIDWIKQSPCCCGMMSESTSVAIGARRRRLSIKLVQGEADDSGPNSRGVIKASTNKPILELIGGRRKMSITGMPAKVVQKAYDNKNVDQNVLQDEEAAEKQFAMGFVCKKGLKPNESPNQDDFCVYRSDDTGIYAVFDGHGPDGHEVSGYVRTNLPRLVLESPDYEDNPAAALSSAFVQCHARCTKAGVFDTQRSGTTATMVLQRKDDLYVAHVGDSRAILARRRSSRGLVGKDVFYAEDLTEDHKPELERERERIEASGGDVLKVEGDIPHRVYKKGCSQPGLAMSRSIGDEMAASVGVSCIPDVSVVKLQDIAFIMLCSDGVWEFITSQEAADIVGGFPAESVQQAAEVLGEESRRRWIEEEHDVVDDITVLCLWFE